MPRPSNTEQRRAEIADALVRVMSRRGYAAASVARVAAEAGLTPGLVHYHFPNKRAILLFVLHGLTARHQLSLDHALEQAGDDPAARLAAFVRAHLATGKGADPETLACWVMLSGEALRDDEVRLPMQKALSRLTAILVEIVEDGRDRALFGGTAPPQEVAAALLAAVQGYFVLAATAREVVPRGSAARSALAMAAGLLHPARPLQVPAGARGDR